MKSPTDPINIFEGHVSRCLVSAGQFGEMSRPRKDRRRPKNTGECDDEQTFSYLWTAVECCVQESVACRVSHGLKRFAYFFRDVVAAKARMSGTFSIIMTRGCASSTYRRKRR